MDSVPPPLSFLTMIAAGWIPRGSGKVFDGAGHQTEQVIKLGSMVRPSRSLHGHAAAAP
jgi:hypothetical protein